MPYDIPGTETASGTRDSGIGTSVDSYYEYMIKSHVLFGDHEYLLMFQQAYAAVKGALQRFPWYIDANMDSKNLVWPIFNALQ
eukprot:505423-Rhodomonas_salina.1